MARAAVEIARHGVRAVVHDAHLGARVRGGEREFEPEHARTEHDDATAPAHGLEHAFGVVEIAERRDALGERIVVRHESVAVLLERGAVASVPFDAVERRHVGTGAGGEHEAVVRHGFAGAQQHGAVVAVDRGRGDPEQHASARSFGGDAVADEHRIELGVADGVLGHEHAVVRLDVFAGDDGQRDRARRDRWQQLLDEAGADRAVADEDDPEGSAHTRTPASTRRLARTTLVLNSGIDDTGSTASLVRRFAACSSP